jgi:hypothetical protein
MEGLERIVWSTRFCRPLSRICHRELRLRPQFALCWPANIYSVKMNKPMNFI